MGMSNGGYRPGSGRKKGSIPWNKGKAFPQMIGNTNGFVKGQTAWNKNKQMPETMREKMRGNTNGKGNKGRTITLKWREKMRQAKLGKPSHFKGKKHTLINKDKMSKSQREYLLSVNPSYDYRLDSKTREGNKRIRRERLKKFGGSHTTNEWNLLKAQYDFTCPSCKLKEPEIKLTRDHILSLSNCGTDDITNIQPLCVKCNSKKATKTIKY